MEAVAVQMVSAPLGGTAVLASEDVKEDADTLEEDTLKAAGGMQVGFVLA